MITLTVGVHIGSGLVAVICGVGAMLTRKGSRRHRGLGRLYLFALTGLGVTAPILAAVDWAHRWHLAVLGMLALGAAAIGFTAIRVARPRRLGAHIVGMGTAYVLMLTAFYVDNGPRLPLWDRLPSIALWLLPAALGAPIIIRARRRHLPGQQAQTGPAGPDGPRPRGRPHRFSTTRKPSRCRQRKTDHPR